MWIDHHLPSSLTGRGFKKFIVKKRSLYLRIRKNNLLLSDPRSAEGKHRIISEIIKGMVCSVNQMSSDRAGEVKRCQQKKGGWVQRGRDSVVSDQACFCCWIWHEWWLLSLKEGQWEEIAEKERNQQGQATFTKHDLILQMCSLWSEVKL